MPELPDVTVYVERLAALAGGDTLTAVRVANPFVLRTAEPPINALVGKRLAGVERLGKRLVMRFGRDWFVVIHLMIAGRLRWKSSRAPLPRKVGLCAFDFGRGTLLLTEAGTTRRASVHLVRGRKALAAFDRGGIEVLGASPQDFASAIRRENHTLKRTLTDPRLLSGIGNTYSDEILHRAGLSPVQLTSRLTDDQIEALRRATCEVLEHWTQSLRDEVGEGFPDKVTAFREGMAVHGRYRQPCPTCSTPVQRIVQGKVECNYCPSCQTGGKLLADRALSRLLRGDWPRTLEEMDERVERGR